MVRTIQCGPLNRQKQLLTTDFDGRLGNGLTTAQERDERTTGYLDTVNIPPIINKGPWPAGDNMSTLLEEVHVNGNGLREKVPHVVVEQLVEVQMTIPS